MIPHQVEVSLGICDHTFGRYKSISGPERRSYRLPPAVSVRSSYNRQSSGEYERIIRLAFYIHLISKMKYSVVRIIIMSKIKRWIFLMTKVPTLYPWFHSMELSLYNRLAAMSFARKYLSKPARFVDTRVFKNIKDCLSSHSYC
jgi:hypothetical protein